MPTKMATQGAVRAQYDCGPQMEEHWHVLSQMTSDDLPRQLQAAMDAQTKEDTKIVQRMGAKNEIICIPYLWNQLWAYSCLGRRLWTDKRNAYLQRKGKEPETANVPQPTAMGALSLLMKTAKKKAREDSKVAYGAKEEFPKKIWGSAKETWEYHLSLWAQHRRLLDKMCDVFMLRSCCDPLCRAALDEIACQDIRGRWDAYRAMGVDERLPLSPDQERELLPWGKLKEDTESVEADIQAKRGH